MDMVCDRLWIGNASDGRDVEALRAAGITAVMNATAETDSIPKDEFAYLRLDQNDGAPIPSETLARFLEWMDPVWSEGHTVLIHCGAGISRAASFSIAWLMKLGSTWDEAEGLVRQARPIIQPHPQLKRSVLAWFGLPDLIGQG